MYHQTNQTPEKIDKEREMQLNIKEVKIGKTGTTKKGVKWTQYMVLFEDGQKASTFDNKIACLGGQTIDVELEQDGNYTNIKSWSATSDAPTPAPTTTTITAIQPSKEASIERQVALKCACETAYETDTIEAILDRAARFANWINNRT
jgi:hypothetical protein